MKLFNNGYKESYYNSQTELLLSIIKLCGGKLIKPKSIKPISSTNVTEKFDIIFVKTITDSIGDGIGKYNEKLEKIGLNNDLNFDIDTITVSTKSDTELFIDNVNNLGRLIVINKTQLKTLEQNDKLQGGGSNTSPPNETEKWEEEGLWGGVADEPSSEGALRNTLRFRDESTDRVRGQSAAKESAGVEASMNNSSPSLFARTFTRQANNNKKKKPDLEGAKHIKNTVKCQQKLEGLDIIVGNVDGFFKKAFPSDTSDGAATKNKEILSFKNMDDTLFKYIKYLDEKENFYDNILNGGAAWRGTTKRRRPIRTF